MRSRNLPPLNALKAFDAAARNGGFRAAAAELNVTHSVIGRHVRNLEARLGVQLFETTKKGVALTEAGESYSRKILAAFDAIATASDDLQERHGAQKVTILSPSGFSTKWLAPRLHKLADAFPKATIISRAEETFGDIVSGKADFAIAFGDEGEFDGEQEFLAEPPVFPVCSPDYLARKGPFTNPESLLTADLLHEDMGDWWEDWFKWHGIVSNPSTRLVLLSADQTIDAAMNSRGIALANNFLVSEDIREGRLVALPSQDYDGGAYWFLWKNIGLKNTLAGEIADWIRHEITRSQNEKSTSGAHIFNQQS